MPTRTARGLRNRLRSLVATDDLVARGYLVDERADHPERQGRYRVSPEQAEPLPGADAAVGGGGLRAVMGGGDGGADGGGDGGEKKEAGSVERRV